MSERRFVAYFRVSTQKQGQSGLGLEAQRTAVGSYLASCAGEALAEFTEVESGKNSARPQLAAAMAAARKHRAVLVIAKLDRLARDAHFLLGLQKAGVEFTACDLPNANRLTVGIMALVAEEEARLISIRTKAALAAAKARGVTLGNPAPGDSLTRGREVLTAKADDFAKNIRPYIEAARQSGAHSLKAVAEALNARGIKTARGGQWYPATVRLVLNRKAPARADNG